MTHACDPTTPPIDAICTEPFGQFETLDAGSLLVRAPAKINLDLHVGLRQPSGFHDLTSSVAKITFYDTITLQRAEEFRFSSTGLACCPDEENLAWRAASVMAEKYGQAKIAISLHKKIPPGMGLGGGSSDAAATLIGINRLLNLEITNDELMHLAAELGSDVPLFLRGACSKISGRGQIVESAEIKPFFAVLILPTIHCSTADVYQKFDEICTRTTGVPPVIANCAGIPPVNADTVIANCTGETPVPTNDLTKPAFDLYPQLSEIHQTVQYATGKTFAMTGSGAGLFCLCDTLEIAKKTRDNIPKKNRTNTIIVKNNPW